MGQAGRGRCGWGAGNHDGGLGADRAAGAGEPGTEAGERNPEDRVGFFRRGGAGPQAEVTEVSTAVLVEYVDEHRDRFGVEPICTVLRESGQGR